jgi:hypothetical protein
VCSYFDTTDGYLRFISTIGQTTAPFFFCRNFFRWFEKIAGQMTVPFFPVIIFSGRNWCSYFDTSTNFGTYIQPEKNTTRKKRYSHLAGHVFWWVQITTKKNYDPKKKGTVVWPMVEIHVFWWVQITTGNNFDPKKKGTVVWPTVEINLR